MVENLWAKMRDDTEPVIRGISFTLEAGQKLAVCGTIGSGAPALMLAMFRIVEPQAGRIVIDDVDISRMGLRDLRSSLVYLPMDPVIFGGTVRTNLDPKGQVKNDEEFWRVLYEVRL